MNTTKKVLLYLSTFLLYMSIDMRRACYSFNKTNIQKHYGVNNFFISMMDAWLFFNVGIGSFLKFTLSNSLKPTQTCLWTCVISASAYAIIPIVALSQQNEFQNGYLQFSYFILIISIGLFAFFSFASFPSTLAVFCHTFNNKQHGKLVGIWSTRGNVGHMLGFFIPNIIVYQLGAPWQVTMIVCSIILVLSALVLYIFIDNPQTQRQKQISSQQFYQFVQKIWKNADFKFYIFSLSLFKIILYTYELWTPKFLTLIGFSQYSGYVPSVFDGATIFGSFIFGYLYQMELNSTSKILKMFSKTKFLVSSVLIIAALILSATIRGSITIYFGFAVLLGIFLGATYNFLQSSQLITYSGSDIQKGDMFSTFSTGVSSLILSLASLILGLSINLGRSQKQSQQEIQQGAVYYFLSGIAVLIVIIAVVKEVYKGRNDQNVSNDGKNNLEGAQIDQDQNRYNSLVEDKNS